MSDRPIRRTIRRCVAILLVPLTLLAMIPIAQLHDDGVAVSHPVLQFGDEIALLLLVGALSYLVGSVVYQLITDEDSESRDRSGREVRRI